MRQYQKINSVATISKVSKTVEAQAKIKVADPDLVIVDPVSYISNGIAKINCLHEFADSVDHVYLDEFYIPDALKSAIQPSDVRIFPSSKFQNLKDFDSFFCDKAANPILTVAEWNQSWQLIMNCFKKDFKPGDGSTKISELRKSTTIGESNIKQLVMDDGHSAPMFDREQDAIIITELPYDRRYITLGFDDVYISDRILLKVCQMAKKN